jgi:uroporphyrinogen decarboxylase
MGIQIHLERPTMTSKERVITAYHHEIPDRVPIDYSSNPGIHTRLLQHFGLHEGDQEGILQALGVDFRGTQVRYTGPRLFPEVPHRRVNPTTGIRTAYIEHSSGGYWDYVDFPMKDASDETIRNWPVPNPDHYDYSTVPDHCSRNRDYCVYTGDPGLADIINKSGMVRTMEQTLVDLVTEDPAFLNYLDRRLAVDLEVTRRILEAAKGGIDLLVIGEDLGTQIGPMISLDMYRRILRPRHQKFVDLGKACSIPVMIHSCGSSSWAFDNFLDMGITVVDTLQPEARDMAPAYLKSRFGKRLSFHGAISTAGPLAYGTVQDVIKTVRETLDIMMPGGGYACAPTHAIQDNSPTENVLAMYETAREYGRY